MGPLRTCDSGGRPTLWLGVPGFVEPDLLVELIGERLFLFYRGIVSSDAEGVE